jgi:hypothetical protein
MADSAELKIVLTEEGAAGHPGMLPPAALAPTAPPQEALSPDFP